MGRLVAIDFGQKRVGIAVSDPLQIIANGLTTVSTGEIFEFLRKYVATEQVEAFIVGLPKQMNNEDSESMKYITPFVNGLRNNFKGIEVHMFDERFTSKMAQQTMFDSGLGKKDRKNKSLIDQISATIILQSYMESKR